MVKSCEKLLFNDKIKFNVALAYAPSFGIFFKTVDEKTFKEHLLPKIDFVIKRNEEFLPNVIAVLKQLSFKL